MMISTLFSLLPQDLYRRYLLKRVAAGALFRYLQIPLASRKKTVFDTEFVALDFETSGLDAKNDRLLSIGYVVIRHGRIILKEKNYYLVKPDIIMQADNVAIHGITDDAVQSGSGFAAAMEDLLSVIAGRVMIVHHASVEKNFINRACQKLYGYALPMRVIDTMKLAEKAMKQKQQPIATNSLRLFNLRAQFGLPRYRAHNALEDAIATAELFLAMASRKASDLHSCTLKDFL
ncbi:MAG: exonuclease domain-containing protein [Gammaproteobacteria bacterium]|nr:exonuclease domain-containing protein [Gammaproteobacteria bacterium]